MLYKKTRLEDTFGVNMLAIANGRPETMGLKQIIKANVDFQFEVATRKYTNLLAKEQERKEIQEGLIKACNVIDLVIEILRGSKDRAMAKACLVEGKVDGIKFKSKESRIMAAQLMFTEKQANAILEMRLYKLIGLELEALINEHEETMANIYRYEDILDRRDSMAQVIMNELDGFKKEYSHPRKTVIENGQEAVYKEKELEEMDVVFLMDRFGYAKTVDVSTYERNKEAADAENKYVFTCKNTGRICLFTSTGQMHTIKVLDLPYGKFRDKGTPIDNVSNFSQKNEEIIYITSQKELNLCRVIFATAQSMLKVVDGGEFDVTKRTVAATKLAEGDCVVNVAALTDQRNIVLQTRGGFFLRFSIDEIPEKKKGAIGVRGMKLADKDVVENVYYTKNAVETTIEYKGKELILNNLKLGKRDSKGTNFLNRIIHTTFIEKTESNHMRVIAGTARSLPLKTPEGMDTRPTTDRIKETLFNMLQTYIPDCVFVDIFSGSGGIGIEALSRGARKAYFIENAPKALACIEDNLAFTKMKDRAIVLKQDACAGLTGIYEKHVDVIFMDPPYDQEQERRVLEQLRYAKYVSEETLILVEASLHTDFSYAEDLGFEVIREKKYKTNKHVFLRKK